MVVRFVVMPCLNEGRGLTPTCASLGMFDPDPSAMTRFVLVDNGSEDNTLAAMRAVAGRSTPGTVMVTEEPERGYVPARRRGAEFVREVAAGMGLTPDEALVLQVDADTTYGKGYLDAMSATAEAVGPGTMVQGLSVPPRPEADSCANFRALERLVDDFVTGLAPTDPRDDVVVDDKVAAYRLSDYLSWGGHVRDHASDGSELFAETTRLMLRARARGAVRVTAADAVAWTSQRRVLEDPAMAFATAGYPRRDPWRRDWHASYAGATRLETFVPSAIARPDLRQAVLARACHVLGLFGVLPAYVGVASDGRPAGPWSRLLDDLGLGSSSTLFERPSSTLERALSITPSHIEDFVSGLRCRPPWNSTQTTLT